MTTPLTMLEEEMAPLRRAEGIVRHGPDADAGKLPCEDEPEAQCLTFTQLNRLRFTQYECGCAEEDGVTLLLCKAHDGGPASEREIKEWLENPTADSYRRSTATQASEIEEMRARRKTK